MPVKNMTMFREKIFEGVLTYRIYLILMADYLEYYSINSSTIDNDVRLIY